METSIKVLGAVVLCVLGMYGLHHDIEYSGWVLFVGCMMAWCV